MPLRYTARVSASTPPQTTPPAAAPLSTEVSKSAVAAASDVPAVSVLDDSINSGPLRWLLLLEPTRTGHGATSESAAPQDLLRALRNTGVPVAIAPLLSASSLGSRGLLGSHLLGPTLIVAAAELDTLLQLCERARGLAADGRTAGLLACLLQEQALLPAIMLQAAERVRASGADDVLLGVPPAFELLNRARSVRQLVQQRRAATSILTQQQALTKMLQQLVGDRPSPMPAAREEGAPEPIAGDGSDSASEVTFVFAAQMELLRGALGCAQVALLLLGDEADSLTVVAGSLDPSTTCIPGPRHNYPQLRAALAGTGMSGISEPREHLLLSRALTGSPSLAEGALWAVPVAVPAGPGESAAATWGLLVLEHAADSARQTLRESHADQFMAAAANVLALGIRTRSLDEVLRDRTRRVRIHQPPPAAKRPVLHYREFFESSADGVMVLDSSARVVWLNRAAEQMTGYATAGLAGHLLSELLPPSHRENLFRTVEQVIAGGPPPSQQPLASKSLSKVFDLQLTSTSSEVLTLSVSTSSVLVDQNYVVLSFRDVTEKRVLETELRKTKEFLERLIDSTVDGIIAADIHGKVVLFNQGAARITGYTPEEVIGKLPVRALYPDREAFRIMAQLRSGEHGGKGRLLQSRRTILGKNGTMIPVALTASIIYEDQREVATVGILSDLRERLRIEQRLMQTEERLAASERQALIVELAGTAAHELNQPLTSVMGYAELLRRRIPDSYRDVHEFADILVREAERMADIVRKIGRITRYETKTYVGDSRILDLDKSILPESMSELGELPSLIQPSQASPPSYEDTPLFSAVAQSTRDR